MIKTHTAKTLAKYYEKDLWVPELKQTRKCDADFLKQLELGLEDTEYYPILKCSDDLTDVEKGEIGNIKDCDFYDGFIFDDSFEISESFNHYGHPIQYVWYLLSIGAGAISSDEYATGYTSIHDGLPCLRWSDVFGSEVEA